MAKRTSVKCIIMTQVLFRVYNSFYYFKSFEPLNFMRKDGAWSSMR